MSYSRSGGGYAPAIIEPYPAQTALYAEMVKQAPGLAGPMMNLLQEQHNVGEAAYNDQFQQMRQAQLAALHQQMIDNRTKAMDLGFRSPGALALQYAADPSLFGGATPDDVQQAIATSGRSFDIANLGKVGAAAKDFTESNVQLPPSYYTNLVPNAPFTAGTPVSSINADIAGRYHLAGQQAAAGIQTIPVVGTVRDPHTMQYPHGEIKVPYGATPEQVKILTDDYRRKLDAGLTGQPTTPGAAIPPSPGQPAPGTAPTGAPGSTGSLRGSAMNVDPNNPLLGGLGGDNQPTPISLTGITPTGLRPPPAGTTYAPEDTPANAPAQPAQTTTAAPPSKPAPTGGAQAAPVQPTTQQLPDTPPGGTEDHSTKYGITLQNRAIQGLRSLSPAARAEVILMRQHNGNIIPIRRIGGVEYYVGAKGNLLGRVP